MDTTGSRETAAKLAKLMEEAIPGSIASEAPVPTTTVSKAKRRFWGFERLTGIFTTLIFCGTFGYNTSVAWAKLEGVTPAYVRWVNAMDLAFTFQQLLALMIFSLVIGTAMGAAYAFVSR